MIHQLRKPDAAVAAPSLFDNFDGLPEGAFEWEFYQHAGNWQNRLIHGDSSEVMQSLIARDGLAGRVPMIYFDPPYGIGFKSNFMTATDRLETKDDATGVPVGDTNPNAHLPGHLPQRHPQLPRRGPRAPGALPGTVDRIGLAVRSDRR